MKLWPRSFAGHMLLLVSGALLLAQAINLTLMVRQERARRASNLEAGAIVRTVDSVERVRNGLAPTRPNDGRQDRVNVAATPAAAPGARRDKDLEARLQKALAEIGMPGSDVRAYRIVLDHEERERLTLWANLDSSRWVNLTSPPLPSDSLVIAQLVGQTLILLLALLTVVILIGRHVARPLRLLSEASERLGSPRCQEPVVVRGPMDVRRLISTFNQMQSRITDMLDEKDTMLGAIGHDLRTPLASLCLRAESMEDSEERQRMIETIGEMSRTLEDILALARLGRSTENMTLVDLTALVDSLVQDLKDLGQPITLAASMRVLVNVRPVLMRRALRNLLENAVKYGSNADLRLYLQQSEAVIEIDDEGPGIPDEDIERVTRPFVRLDSSRNRVTGGSGLGLTIARSIIHDHGGTLGVKNMPAGGLRVTVRLALA